ncbi:hypothetical protein ACP70R_030256 [Stipagrostis hirtigluma subsp. patula]
MALAPSTGPALLAAQLELWQSTFAYVKSMALKCALDLGIADAIHHHGGAATLPQIAAEVTVHPSKLPGLCRLMRVLTATGVFSAQPPAGGASGTGEQPLYALTPASRLLVGAQSQVAITAMTLHPALVSSFFELGRWFQRDLPDPCIFELKNGHTFWELGSHDATFNLDDGMVSDSGFIMDIAVKECGEIFQGISSLVDVGGGLGSAAQAISKAFPHVRCSVLDLDHVVAKAPPNDTRVKYIAGDMFQSVPPANAVLLKWVLHDWGDEECVRILKNCKRAIPPRDAGGKVIIIDMVVGVGPSDSKHREMQAVFDLYMIFLNGTERNEQEWSKIFSEAGFSDYKITPVLGVRSIIEVYP